MKTIDHPQPKPNAPESWTDDTIWERIMQQAYQANGRNYDIVMNRHDIRDLMKEMRDDLTNARAASQATIATLTKRVDALAKNLSIADALVHGQVDAIARLEAQVAELRGDSGPNPVVEWKGWQVELAFDDEGGDE